MRTETCTKRVRIYVHILPRTLEVRSPSYKEYKHLSIRENETCTKSNDAVIYPIKLKISQSMLLLVGRASLKGWNVI